MKDVIPSSKLSKAQRQVALSRAMDKMEPANRSMFPQMPQVPVMSDRTPMVEEPEAEGTEMLPEASINNIPEELSDVDQQTQFALIADQLWKDSGGDESLGGKIWADLKKQSPSSRHLDSARDYFISSFVKYKMDPPKYSKAHPREARLISRLSDAFEASQPEA